MGYYRRSSNPASAVFAVLICCMLFFAVHDDGNKTETVKNIEGEELDYLPVSGETAPEDADPYILVLRQSGFTKEAFRTEPGTETYADLDGLGRCGAAFACLGPETLPEEKRGAIGHIRPTGWHTVKYKGIDGNYLYNRCHLIAFSLAGENDNEKNLITGTRFMNVEGMLPFEMQVLDYIRETGNHVLYRVTPVFAGEELVARGVTINAASVEDDEICFTVFCPNIQPGIAIDYTDGTSTGPAYE